MSSIKTICVVNKIRSVVYTSKFLKHKKHLIKTPSYCVRFLKIVGKSMVL